MKKTTGPAPTFAILALMAIVYVLLVVLFSRVGG